MPRVDLHLRRSGDVDDGFFVILWVLKPNPNKTPAGSAAQTDDLVKAEASIREAFGYTPDPTSKDPVDIEMLLKKIQTLKLNGPGEKGKTTIERKGAEGIEDEVTAIRRSKQAAVGGRLLFAIGDSEISPDMIEPLNEIADQIRGHRTIVMIKGHTGLDDFPDGGTAQQNMDLSLKRAQHVADYLVSKGVSADILRVQGCSTFEPVIQRAYTPEGRASNRRVEVEATATLVQSFQDPPATQPMLPDTPALAN
jgi:outer membrane protein OmpA-like peptidoglycan-associated protein